MNELNRKSRANEKTKENNNNVRHDIVTQKKNRNSIEPIVREIDSMQMFIHIRKELAGYYKNIDVLEIVYKI